MSTEKEVNEEEIDPTAPIEEKETFNLELGNLRFLITKLLI